MIESPIQLTEEQKKARFEKKLAIFKEKYTQLESETHLSFQAVIVQDKESGALIPFLRVVERPPIK